LSSFPPSFASTWAESTVYVSWQGNWQKVMGRTAQRKIYLLGEEALFLIDRGQLEVLVDGYPLTFQHAMRLMLDSEMTLERYLVGGFSVNLSIISGEALEGRSAFSLSFDPRFMHTCGILATLCAGGPRGSQRCPLMWKSRAKCRVPLL